MFCSILAVRNSWAILALLLRHSPRHVMTSYFCQGLSFIFLYLYKWTWWWWKAVYSWPRTLNNLFVNGKGISWIASVQASLLLSRLLSTDSTSRLVFSPFSFSSGPMAENASNNASWGWRCKSLSITTEVRLISSFPIDCWLALQWYLLNHYLSGYNFFSQNRG